MAETSGTAIRPLDTDDRAAWLPLWQGCQAFYGVEIAPEVTPERLLDPVSHGGGQAWRDADAPGLVRFATAQVCSIGLLR